jgi:hypothetical protein
MKEVEQEDEEAEDEDEDEDKWQQRNPKSNESDDQLEWIEGPKNNCDFTVVPNYLTQNKKKKNLMAGTRRRVPAKI